MNDAPDAYAAVVDLIALVVDAKQCVKRVDELQRLGDQIAKVQVRLDADRAEHARAVAAAQAEMLAREQDVRRREVDLAGREGMLAVQLKFIDRWKTEHDFVDADLQPGGTLRRAAS